MKINLLLPITMVCMLLTFSQAQAQPYPSVSNLKPFSAECNYMSHAGYLRYLYFISSGRWLAFEQALTAYFETARE